MEVSKCASVFAGLVMASLSAVPEASAVTLANPPVGDPGFFSSIGFVSVLLSTANLPSWQDTKHAVRYTLADGTVIQGLLYQNSPAGKRPLIIADFGLMSPSTSELAGDLIEKVVLSEKLNADFLVVGDLTSAEFYEENGNLSLGGYDAGRILNELADTLVKSGVKFTSLHLLGESLGGLATLEALVEDERLGTHHFRSAITFSGVTDEVSATATVMSAFGLPIQGISGPAMATEGEIFLAASLDSFDDAVEASGSGLGSPSLFEAGSFFFDQFANRLSFLMSAKNWNPAVSRHSVPEYVQSSGALLSKISATTAPVIVVHAQNDPVVDFSEFASFAAAQAGNPKVQTLATDDGSHCGFLGLYGPDWVADLINRAIAR